MRQLLQINSRVSKSDCKKQYSFKKHWIEGGHWYPKANMHALYFTLLRLYAVEWSQVSLDVMNLSLLGLYVSIHVVLISPSKPVHWTMFVGHCYVSWIVFVGCWYVCLTMEMVGIFVIGRLMTKILKCNKNYLELLFLAMVGICGLMRFGMYDL